MDYGAKMCYTQKMYNWSTDEKRVKAQGKGHALWRLEQMINFGLNGEKISEAELRKYWRVAHIDPARKKFLSLLLNGNKDSH